MSDVYDAARLYRGCAPPAEDVCLGKRYIYLCAYFMFFRMRFKNDCKRPPVLGVSFRTVGPVLIMVS